jgi:sugar-phosphatase
MDPLALRNLLSDKPLLIFDFDGTIADTSPLHAAAFGQVLGPLSIAVHYPSIAGIKTADAIRLCARASGQALGEEVLMALVVAKQKLVRQMIAQQLRPLPGVDQFLRWARQHHQLSMATSGSRGTVELALKKLGYLQLFDPLVCADDVKHTKPSPDIFLNILSLTGYLPDQAVVFEDSDAGIAAAKNAGILCIDVRGFNWVISGMMGSCG